LSSIVGEVVSSLPPRPPPLSSIVDEVLSSMVVGVLGLAREVAVCPLRLVEAELSSTLVDDPLSSRLVDVLGVVVLVGESSEPLAHAIPTMSKITAMAPPIVAVVFFDMLNLLGLCVVQACDERRHRRLRVP
jgi:hypothetical protein